MKFLVVLASLLEGDFAATPDQGQMLAARYARTKLMRSEQVESDSISDGFREPISDSPLSWAIPTVLQSMAFKLCGDLTICSSLFQAGAAGIEKREAEHSASAQPLIGRVDGDSISPRLQLMEHAQGSSTVRASTDLTATGTSLRRRIVDGSHYQASKGSIAFPKSTDSPVPPINQHSAAISGLDLSTSHPEDDFLEFRQSGDSSNGDDWFMIGPSKIESPLSENSGDGEVDDYELV